MANLAIKGHETRGKEVIGILEMLGGKNYNNHNGAVEWAYFIDMSCHACHYYIDGDGNIECSHVMGIPFPGTFFTLEEFLEKYPYKIGDKVRIPDYKSEIRIDDMEWDGSEVQYGVVTDEIEWYSAKELNEFNEPNKEEVMEDKLVQIKIAIPDGYEFFGIDDGSKIVLTKKQPRYPKTYGECCKIITAKYDTHYFYTKKDKEEYPNEVKLLDCLDNLRKLLICRDAYWKIAGEQMGLGKPWEPNWEDESEDKYTIVLHDNKNCYANCKGTCSFLTFPTAEMRDAFYENFKDLIEECKEFL